MSDIRVERTETSVRFLLKETKPYGEDDVERVEERPLADLSRVSRFLPDHALLPFGYMHTRLFWMHSPGAWLGFNFTSFPERCDGPWDEAFEGPYIVEGEPAPSPEEVEAAQRSGRLVEHIRIFGTAHAHPENTAAAPDECSGVVC